MFLFFPAYLLLVLPVVAGEAVRLEEQVSELFSGRKDALAAKEVDRKSARLPEQDRVVYRAVWRELTGTPQERIDLLAPMAGGKREFVASHPFAACSLADAYALNSAIQQAEATLELLPSNQTEPLDRADMFSAKTRILMARKRLDDAQAMLNQAQTAIGRAVPDAAYESWRSRLVKHRLSLLRRDLEAAKAIERAGPAYWAWLQADRARKLPAYLQAAKEFPGTIFADAATVEAARICQAERNTRECLKILNGASLQKGPLAASALILKGDVLLRSGQSPALAKNAYETALGLLRNLPELPAEITPAMRAAIMPERPPHQLDNSGFPEWHERSTGSIFAPALDASIACYLRYQVLVRLAVLAYASGDRETAEAMARSLATFDDVDRQMEQDKQGPGALILAHTLKTGDSTLIPLDCFRGAPDGARARLLMGAAFYQVYDWKQCGEWLEDALERAAPWDALSRNAAKSLLACAEQMLRHYDRALAIAGEVRLKPGDAPNQPWFLARHVEFGIYQHADDEGRHVNFPKCIAAMQEVLDKAPGTSFARDALLLQMSWVDDSDLPRVIKAHETFLATFPNEACATAVKKDLLKLKQQIIEKGKDKK
jgi:tetratricopeptide (TPR) repeat protein